MKKKRKPKVFIGKLNKRILFLVLVLLVMFVIIAFLSNTRIFQTLGRKSGEVIVVDPGHGGIDGGTSDSSGLLEKDINLDVSLKLKKELNKEGFNVIMTRNKDESLEEYSNVNASRYKRDLNARKTIVNENKPKAFISIHVNSNKRSSARGVQVYYYPTSDESRRLAENICESINEIVYRDYLGDYDLEAQPMAENFFILRETEASGVLVEIGFITNLEDNKLLQDNKYKKKIAIAIMEGIKMYSVK
ncbi:MAG TPA: N-acetylmuramoyl-L-alanine amidase [Tissierellales bacterium]|nr:N-acetylmuramoyl-L-alanine amidase [Tissierellales bacterium]